MRQPSGRFAPGIFVPLAVLALLLVSASGSAVPERTYLAGRVLDPVTDTPIAGATVRLGKATAITDVEGAFSLRLGRRKVSHVATSFEAPGFRTYRTWTETASQTEREVYLFPDRDVSIPGIPGRDTDIVSRELFEEHFNVVYRDEEQVRGRLKRWMRQPEILIVDHEVDWVENSLYTPYRDLVAGSRPLPKSALRRFARPLRDSIGPLTNYRFNGNTIRRLRVRPGEVVVDAAVGGLPPGVMMVYAHRSTTGGGGRFGEGDEILSAYVFRELVTMLKPDDEYTDAALIHEFAHALGMYHPPSYPNQYPLGTPLNSIVSYPDPRFPIGSGTYEITPVDLVTARIAHSRLPGNDRNDADPRPGARTREAPYWFWWHGVAPWEPRL